VKNINDNINNTSILIINKSSYKHYNKENNCLNNLTKSNTKKYKISLKQKEILICSDNNNNRENQEINNKKITSVSFIDVSIVNNIISMINQNISFSMIAKTLNNNKVKCPGKCCKWYGWHIKQIKEINLSKILINK
jgi:hypothetical protein